MSIWKKIFGGAAVAAIGGPLGQLFEKFRAGVGDGAGDGTKQIAFTIAVIALGAKMAKADGVVTREEIDAFREVFQVPDDEVKNVARVFDIARRDTAGYQHYARQVAKLFTENPNVLEDLLGGLFHIAKADGVIHPNELAYLRDVAAIFGFEGAEFDRIRAILLGPDPDDPYAILGLPHGAEDAELKRHYRKLIRDNHPDRAMAQGLPAEFVDLANQKMAAINAAYERIAKQRGLN